MAEKIIQAKCVDKAFDSKNAIQYYPGDEVDIDLSNKDQRKLVWLKTLGGRWVFEFDRANSSSTELRMFFCKDCGQPFDRFTDMGTHCTSQHNKSKKMVGKAQAENADEEEERALARLVAEESGQPIEPEVPDDAPLVLDKRGKKKGRTYTCKMCGAVKNNPYEMRIHHETGHRTVKEAPAEKEPVTA